jgi:hypothetical protein
MTLKPIVKIAATIIFPLYLTMVLLTDFSLTGYWTDVIFSVFFSIYALRLSFKLKLKSVWQAWLLQLANSVATLIIFGLLALNLTNPFAWDTIKLRSFYFQKVDGRLFNAYFKPVGAYAGGYGNFWITETPRYFPVLEWRVYYDRTVDHNFNDDTFEGEPIDNSEVVRAYIKSEVIEKKP